MLRRGSAARLTFTPEGGTARVRALRRTGLVLLLVAGILLIGFFLALELVTSGEEQLFREGARTPGVVTEYNRSARGGGTMDVRFAIDETERVRTVRLNTSSPPYQVGQQVTVIYDRSDPERIRTDAEQNEPFGEVTLLILALVTGVMLLPAGLAVWLRWGGRYSEARDLGWRHGQASIRLKGGRRILDVRLDNGRTLCLRAFSLRVRGGRFNGAWYSGEAEVLVGGEGRVVLFGDGPFVTATQVIDPVR
ncbi:DUF3592 domain-containing protein [Actinocrispum sp. NPDC049592]|uniref:DUF3592 domain-containing protein n=1 Tax=Actinocrispum sp. NPDC049592 TaxID=3154835 RepID=UPI003424307F